MILYLVVLIPANRNYEIRRLESKKRPVEGSVSHTPPSPTGLKRLCRFSLLILLRPSTSSLRLFTLHTL